MKEIIFSAGIFLANSSFANTMIYSCEPQNDDGDAYGETLVIGITEAKEGTRKRILNLLSDYMGASSGITDFSGNASTTVTFSKFDTSAYDSNGSYVKDLKITVPKTLIENGPTQAIIKIADGNREGVDYSCTRISE